MKKFWFSLTVVFAVAFFATAVYAVTMNSPQGRLDAKGITDSDGHELDITSDGKVVCQ